MDGGVGGHGSGQSHLEFLASAQTGEGLVWRVVVEFPPPEGCRDEPFWQWYTCFRAFRLAPRVKQIPNAIPLGHGLLSGA